MSEIFFQTLADLCVNLSAGWLGAIYIVSVFSRRSSKVNERLVWENSGLAIAFFVAAYILNAI